MIDSILRNGSISILIAGLAAAALVLAGSSIYDVAYTIKRRSLAMKTKRQRLPMISIIIYSYNQPQETIACLESLVKNPYRKLQVQVVDNASKDSTVAEVKQFISKHRKKDIRIISKRKYVPEYDALKPALKSAKGDIVLILTPRHRLEPKSLRQAAGYFAATGADALMPAVIASNSPSLLNLWARYINFGMLNKQKAASLVSSQGSSIRFGIFLRKQFLGRKVIEAESIYCSDVTLKYAAAPTIGSPTLNYYPLISAKPGARLNVPLLVIRILKTAVIFILPVFFWYSLYEALNNRYMDLLVVSFSLFSGFMVLAVWSLEQLKLIQKIKYSLITPAIFSVFIVMTYIQPAGLIIKLIAKLFNKTAKLFSKPFFSAAGFKREAISS